MTESEIASIEDQVGRSLPVRYRNLLLDYPEALLEMAEVYPGPKGHPPERVGPENAELYNAPELLHVANMGDVEFKNSIFPEEFFIIGDSGCGDYYAIDPDDDAAAVYMSGSHPSEHGDACSNFRICASIEEWVARVIAGNAP